MVMMQVPTPDMATQTMIVFLIVLIAAVVAYMIAVLIDRVEYAITYRGNK